MTQPGKEKICSFQAAALALEQAHLPLEFTSTLSDHLDRWLNHILKTGVKMGKRKIRKTKDMQALDVTPSAYVAEHLVCAIFVS
jgi:hypothetical protein